MALFGLSDAGKVAEGNISGIPIWLLEAMIQAMGRGNEAFGQSQGALNSFDAYLRNVLMQPDIMAGGDINEILGYGSTAIPGVEDAITGRQSEIDRLRQLAGQIPSQSVIDQSKWNLDAYKVLSSGLTDITRDITDRMFGSLYDQSNKGYASLQDDVRNTYANTMQNTINAWDNFRNTTGTAYDAALLNLDQLLPSGDFQAATAARAFAPQLAAAKSRLRAYGIDPNSPEASGILQSIETARSRSIDDALGRTGRDVINQQNLLTLGKADADVALGREKENIYRGLQLDQMAQRMGLTKEQFLQQMGLTEAQANAAIDQLNQRFERDTTALDQSNAIAQLSRQLGLEDYDIQTNLANLANDAALQGIDLRNLIYQTGVGGMTRGMGRKDQLAGQLGDLGTFLRQYQQGQDRTAQGFGNDALAGFKDALTVEGANSGWLGKLLGGIGVGALSLIPGVGPALSAMAGSGLNASGLFGSGGFGGGMVPQNAQASRSSGVSTVQPAIDAITGGKSSGSSNWLSQMLKPVIDLWRPTAAQNVRTQNPLPSYRTPPFVDPRLQYQYEY